MGCRVEPPGPLLEAEGRDHALGELALPIGIESTVQERGVDLGRIADEVGQCRAENGEDVAHLRRRHPGLVVVEQGRVRFVGGLEALDVAAFQLDIRAEVRQERGEVVVPACLDPRVVPARRRARHLDAQLRRHPARLLPVAPRDADQARIVRVVRQRLLERREAVEQTADLGIGEAVVDDPAERGERVRARCRAEGRHRDALLPAENACGAAEIRDLRKSLAQGGEIVHLREPTEAGNGSALA